MTAPSTAGVLDVDAADLFGLTTALVAVPSESHHEAELADLVEARLRERAPSLAIDRIDANVVVRTSLGRDRRVVLGGHLDTVPANGGNDVPTIDGDVLRGLGSADMKSGLAVLLRIAEELHASVLQDGASRATHDVTLVFYEAEEVRDEFNGLGTVFEQQPELLAGDFAVLLEPTDGWVEAGCQGVLVAKAGFDGERAHAARPWMGSNAIHAAGGIVDVLRSYVPREPVVDGLRYHEGLNAVFISGGVAGNVVPDACEVQVNYRFAPDRPPEDAAAHVTSAFAGFEVEILDVAPGARPGLDAPVAAAFVAATGGTPRPKLGWTDVARFAELGIPAVNYGPGISEIAHTPGEYVELPAIAACERALRSWLAP